MYDCMYVCMFSCSALPLVCGNPTGQMKHRTLDYILPYATIRCWACGKHQCTSQRVRECSPAWGPQPELGTKEPLGLRMMCRGVGVGMKNTESGSTEGGLGDVAL